MKVAEQELVTGAEIGRRLGFSRARASQLAQQPSFPDPIGSLGRANVWRWADIEEWAERTGRELLNHEN